MPKKYPPEHHLRLPSPPTTAPILDTHTHLASTFESYSHRYKNPNYNSVFDFVSALYANRNIHSIVDVWCEAPIRNIWRQFADAEWHGINYSFVMGIHPHEAKNYTDDVESEILQAMSHPRCVGWGEIGLDYHYDLSPRDIQRSIFRRQLQHAVRLRKPLTIHTREAEQDTESILKEEVPSDHPIHVHCFTDSPEFAQRLLDHFPNLYIGITGVITYTSNLSTSRVIQNLVSSSSSLRILLETDAPYMIPANLYASLDPELKGKKLPLCHTAMIPWIADFVADVANKATGDGENDAVWDADKVMHLARENARRVYGI